ncbi:MAG: Rrf2 family transcriptional regulator [Chloroherpetonaceae bacterium]|nr:Rrf2 family transcriptional regulator [Chloroherpetonaceae bacterium]MDW8436877.1 Rrf2 family transcriptional regulator [Chloroherpetonaceae bacterium]
MLKLTKRFEYGLLAVRYIAQMRNGDVATAKEIAEQTGVSYELVAKILQQLTKAEIVASVQGVKGGYRLNKPAAQISFTEIAEAVDEPIQLIDCAENPDGCSAFSGCSIKKPLAQIQTRFREIFSETKVAELL